MWGSFLAVAAGGAFGAMARFGIALAMPRGTFPWATLTVNASGSLLFGFLAIWLAERLPYAAELRAFVLVGLLGGFTTFSTFSAETIALLENQELARAAANIAANLLACLAAVSLGFWLARQLG